MAVFVESWEVRRALPPLFYTENKRILGCFFRSIRLFVHFADDLQKKKFVLFECCSGRLKGESGDQRYAAIASPNCS